MVEKRRIGGSRKGRPNKATAKREAEIAASGLTPLDFLLSVLRDKRKPIEVRIDAAKAVAPYVHPKLSNVQLSTPPGQPIETREVGTSEPELIGAYLKRLARAAKGSSPSGADTGSDPGVVPG